MNFVYTTLTIIFIVFNNNSSLWFTNSLIRLDQSNTFLSLIEDCAKPTTNQHQISKNLLTFA